MTTEAETRVTEQDIQLAVLYLQDGVIPDELARQFSVWIRDEVMLTARFRAYNLDPHKFAHLRPKRGW